MFTGTANFGVSSQISKFPQEDGSLAFQAKHQQAINSAHGTF